VGYIVHVIDIRGRGRCNGGETVSLDNAASITDIVVGVILVVIEVEDGSVAAADVGLLMSIVKGIRGDGGVVFITVCVQLIFISISISISIRSWFVFSLTLTLTLTLTWR